MHNFQQYETIRYFSNNIFAAKITLGKVSKDRMDLLNYFIDFKKGTRAKDTEKS